MTRSQFQPGPETGHYHATLGVDEIVPAGDLRITMDLTAAQIRTLQATPVELIPAPGAGKVIFPKRYMGIYTFVSAAYNPVLPVVGMPSDGGYSISVEDQVLLNRGDSHVWSEPCAQYSGNSQVGNPTNQPVTLTCAQDPGNAGDGTLRYIIDYEIVTL